MLNFTSGSIVKGDIITFAQTYSRWRKLWLAIRYMRHNRPDLKPLREFVVVANSSDREFKLDET